MSNETKNSPSDSAETAAWIGLDWADQTHVYCLQVSGDTESETQTLEQTPEAIQQWALQLEQRFSGRPVAICLEQTRGALIYALLNHAFFRIYPVNPHAMAQYRKAFKNSGAKSDGADAWLLLDYLLKHRDRLRLLRPETVEIRLLQLLSEDRRQAVDARTRLHNQLLSQLKSCFPQALDWIKAGNYPWLCAFLKQWPSLERLQKSRPQTIRRFLVQQGCRQMKRYESLLELLPSQQPLTRDPAILRAGSMKIHLFIEQIHCLNLTIAEYDHLIAEVFNQNDDQSIFSSLPGAGPTLAPRLLCALGSNRSRFQSAEEVQTISGIAPVVSSSGKSRWVHWRWACPKFVRQTFHEFAASSIPYSPWASAYYQKMRSLGKGRHAAIRALAYKWIRIIFACWKNRTPYSEELYQKALKCRQPSPSPQERQKGNTLWKKPEQLVNFSLAL
jgi:transposase